jgi:hypothetical protein
MLQVTKFAVEQAIVDLRRLSTGEKAPATKKSSTKARPSGAHGQGQLIEILERLARSTERLARVAEQIARAAPRPSRAL